MLNGIPFQKIALLPVPASVMSSTLHRNEGRRSMRELLVGKQSLRIDSRIRISISIISFVVILTTPGIHSLVDACTGAV